MTTVIFHVAAQPGTRILPDAFHGAIGQTKPLSFDGRTVGECLIEDIIVAPDGDSMMVTISTDANIGLKVELTW